MFLTGKKRFRGLEYVSPPTPFSSMFNANSSDGQLEIEIAALANAFSETVLSESDVFLTLGDFFWSIGSGRCAFAAYKRAKKLALLPDGVAARLQALQKARSATKCLLLRATCPEWNGRKHFSRFASVAV